MRNTNESRIYAAYDLCVGGEYTVAVKPLAAVNAGGYTVAIVSDGEPEPGMNGRARATRFIGPDLLGDDSALRLAAEMHYQDFLRYMAID